jgi:mono/diheme cytochrome c family protein
VLLLTAAGCRQDMHDQPKIEPLEMSEFFQDGRGARPVPQGTVSRNAKLGDDEYLTGRSHGAFVAEFPAPVTKATLYRGKDRYEIFCTPCHGAVGDGRGMVVKRGFPPPTSFHIDRLRASPPGYFFDVITNGFGRMQGYAAQVPVDDRWAVVAYVRALQLSQNATEADVPPDERANLEEAATR